MIVMKDLSASIAKLMGISGKSQTYGFHDDRIQRPAGSAEWN